MIPFSAFSHKNVSVMWTCGESNPGPNKEAIRFLHAYSSLHFRTAARPGPPTAVLSSKAFHQRREAAFDYSRFSLHRLISGFGKTSSERCLVPAPGAGIKPVTYCTSVRQRERNCFRQINLRKPCIIESDSRLSACLHNTSSCCQIHVSPLV